MFTIISKIKNLPIKKLTGSIESVKPMLMIPLKNAWRNHHFFCRDFPLQCSKEKWKIQRVTLWYQGRSRCGFRGCTWTHGFLESTNRNPSEPTRKLIKQIVWTHGLRFLTTSLVYDKIISITNKYSSSTKLFSTPKI